VGVSPTGSKKRSSIASTEHQPVDYSIENNEHYPVDDITERTPCELLTPVRKIVNVVDHGIAQVPRGTIHCMEIPQGYSRVQVDIVESGWEDLDLEVHGGDGETLIGHTIHTWICWAKTYIRLPQAVILSPHISRQRSPSPAATSLLAANLHFSDRSRSLTLEVSPKKTPPQQSTKNTSLKPPPPAKRKFSKQPARQSPPKKKQPAKQKEKPPSKKFP
jgi:hypothetical protein